MIVANDVSAPGVGFEHDTNEVVMVSADGRQRSVSLTEKRKVAQAVFDEVMEIRSE